MNADNEDRSRGLFGLSPKFWRVVLVLVAVLLIFTGPTYVPYVLADLLKVDYVVSIVVGSVLLALGLVLMWFLIRKKVIE